MSADVRRTRGASVCARVIGISPDLNGTACHRPLSASEVADSTLLRHKTLVVIAAGLEPGTWTELVTGVLTAGALAVAALVVWIERRDRRTDRFDAMARQARTIGFWVEEHDVHVVNAGELPIYDVAASCGLDYDFPVHASVLPPGGALAGPHGIDMTELSWTEISLDLLFRDNAGAGWVRELNGTLTRTRGPRDVADMRAGLRRRRTPLSVFRRMVARRRSTRMLQEGWDSLDGRDTGSL